MESSLQNAHTQIQARLQKNFAALEAIASMPYVRDTTVPLEERAASLADFVEQNAGRGYQACAITDATGRAILSFGVEIDVSIDDYFQQAVTGRNVVSDPFVSRATENLLIVYAVPYYDEAGDIAGVITLDVDALHLSEGFTVQGLGETGVAFAIAQGGTTVISTDIETVREQLNDFEEVKADPTLEGLVESERKMLLGESGNSAHVYNGVRELMYYMPIEGTSWGLAVTQANNEAYATVNTITYSGIGAQAQALDGIAQGDYTVGVPVRSEQDVMNKAINHMVASNNRLMGEIRTSAGQVGSGAAQIAGGAQTLATGSTQQAATMQEFSASIGQVHAQADANTQLAQATVQEVQRAAELMRESLDSMQQLNGAMNAIDASSRQIAQVIKVIDDIAFQTNILALNAAVEAARAGQHGKGFAVVADEVRSLAGKSAKAAKETAGLIETSTQSVAHGVEITEKASAELAQVGEIVPGNQQAMGQVSEASAQQSLAIDEINQGITQISNVVQANSATAEESAASAQELSAQSALLNQIVDRFKLKEQPPAGNLIEM